MEVNKMFESCYHKFEVGDVVTFSENVSIHAPYEGVGVVFEKRIMEFCQSEQIHVHWFAPNYNAWYAEHTIVLKKVEAQQ